MALRDKLIDPESPDRRPRRAAYALPTFFTAGNIFLGFFALMESIRGAMVATQDVAMAQERFTAAAIAIGIAVFLDGLDGRIARMTNTVSDFGREMDSLADVISFGIAPAVLAYAWGVEFTSDPPAPFTLHQLHQAGYFFTFLYLLCGAMRLARFNVQVNPVPKNPGRKDRKYFVGLAIPAGAAMVASVVFAANSIPIQHWALTIGWLALLGLLSFLMISTWRYPNFKNLNFRRPHSPLMVVGIGIVIFLIYTVPQPMLLGMSATYMLSGIIVRVGGVVRRRLRNHPEPEQQVG